MLCEKCKEREANVRFTEVFNGKVTEHNLCMECARSSYFAGQKYAALFDGENQLSRLLSGFLSMAAKTQGSAADAGVNVFCPVCKTSYGDFVKRSRFGCADCYDVFELLMEDHIKNLQGSSSHRGKVPMRKRSLVAEGKAVEQVASDQARAGDQAEDPKTVINQKLIELKQELDQALLEENYEEAARLRDEIRALNKELEAGSLNKPEGAASQDKPEGVASQDKPEGAASRDKPEGAASQDKLEGAACQKEADNLTDKGVADND